jgi:hypothetical protein
MAAPPLAANFHLGAAIAQGDFREEMGSKVGLGAGLSLTIPLSGSLSLRPICSYQAYPALGNHLTYKSTRYSDVGDETARWSSWSYGVDGLYRPAGPEGRLYLLAGAYLKAWKLHSYGTYSTADRLNATRVYTVNDTSTKNQPAVAAGLGWTFHRRFSVELRSVLGTYQSLSYNTLEASFVLSW